MPVGGRYEQRSAVFADASLVEGAVWFVQAAVSGVIGSTAWAGVTRGFAKARVRRGAATPRDVVLRVAQEYVQVQYDALVRQPHEEQLNDDGSWRMAFEDVANGAVYSVRLRSPMVRRDQSPRVVGAARKAAMEPPAQG